MKCRQRLYLTADRKKLVGEGDKKGASLYAVPGDEIPQETHDRFGLVDGHLKGFDPDAAAAAAAVEDEPEPSHPTVKCTQALYLTKDGSGLVAEGHEDAGEPYAKPGDEIPQEAHDKFGLVDGHLEGFDPSAPATQPAADKEQKPAADKEQKPADDKEQKPADDKEQKSASDKAQGGGNADQASGAAKARVGAGAQG